MWTEVPVRKLAVLAGDEGVEHHGGNQRIGARGARRILIEPILKDPFVGIPVWPGLQTFGALPVERLVVG